MAIRFKYDVGAQGPAAFFAGQASARRRQEKYAMDIGLLQQQHRNRMQQIGLAGGMRLGGRRAGGGGVVLDPLAPGDVALIKGMPDGPEKDAAIKAEILKRAQRKRRGRLGRLGRADEIPGADLRDFIGPDELEHRRDRESAEAKRLAALEDFKTKEDYTRSLDAAEADEEAFEEKRVGLTTGDYELDGPLDVKLKALQQRLNRSDPSNNYMNDEQFAEFADKAQPQIRDIISQATPIAKPQFFTDPNTGDKFVKYGAGDNWQPFVSETEQQAQEEAKTASETQAKDAEKQQAAVKEQGEAVMDEAKRLRDEDIAARDAIKDDIANEVLPKSTTVPPPPGPLTEYIPQAEANVAQYPQYRDQAPAAPSASPAGAPATPGAPPASEDPEVAAAQQVVDQAIQALNSVQQAADAKQKVRELEATLAQASADTQASAASAAALAEIEQGAATEGGMIGDLDLTTVISPEEREWMEETGSGTPTKAELTRMGGLLDRVLKATVEHYGSFDNVPEGEADKQVEILRSMREGIAEQLEQGQTPPAKVQQRQLPPEKMTTASKKSSPEERRTLTGILNDAGFEHIAEADKGWIDAVAAGPLAAARFLRDVKNNPPSVSQRRGNQRTASTSAPKYTGKQSQKVEAPDLSEDLAALEIPQALAEVTAGLSIKGKQLIDDLVTAASGPEARLQRRQRGGTPDESMDAWAARTGANEIGSDGLPYLRERLDIDLRMAEANMYPEAFKLWKKEMKKQPPAVWEALTKALAVLDREDSPRSTVPREAFDQLKPRSVR